MVGPNILHKNTSLYGKADECPRKFIQKPPQVPKKIDLVVI